MGGNIRHYWCLLSCVFVVRFSMEPWTWVATYSDYKGNELIGGFCELKLLVILKTFLLCLLVLCVEYLGGLSKRCGRR